MALTSFGSPLIRMAGPCGTQYCLPKSFPGLHKLPPHGWSVPAIGEAGEECLCWYFPLCHHQQLHFWGVSLPRVRGRLSAEFRLACGLWTMAKSGAWLRGTPRLVWESFSRDGASQNVGKAFNQGKIFKWTSLAGAGLPILTLQRDGGH